MHNKKGAILVIFKFRFQWQCFVTKEEREELARMLVCNVEATKADEADIKDCRDLYLTSWHEYAGDIAEIITKFPHLKIDVVGLVENNSTEKSFIMVVNTLQKAVAKAENLVATIEELKNSFNAKCDVHVPGFGLLAIDDVRYENDCCTEALQEFIDDGWRILAICPQPDQRRPDYILGRNRAAAEAYLKVK